jgi:hypothetical protein
VRIKFIELGFPDASFDSVNLMDESSLIHNVEIYAEAAGSPQKKGGLREPP